MNLKNKYIVLKAATIFCGALSIPWSTFTGFCFGDGRYFTGLVSLTAQTVVALIDGYIWFWVLENMKNKIQGETLTARKDVVKPAAECPWLSRNKRLVEEYKPEYTILYRYSDGESNGQNELVKNQVTPETTVRTLG
jgi:hypothetical protein